MPPSFAKVISTELLDSKDSKWIKLVKIKYEEVDGQVRTWEATRRTTRPKNSLVDAVQVVAILNKESGPELLLEKQFRPPAGKIVIEFPAGLVDEGETPEQSVVRELMEETGYVGEVLPDRAGPRPILYSSPASSSSSTYLIHVKIDLSKAENKDPKPKLEDGEFIECITVPLTTLYQQLHQWEAEGFAIDGKVGAFADGIETAKAWGLRSVAID
ncbi:putative ADP-ribose pyrophosphatase [Thozetella sp. PMI_491]|nr:putative ADP-ribose pyrophosphatase [Thozetella sp. PMI_491]